MCLIAISPVCQEFTNMDARTATAIRLDTKNIRPKATTTATKQPPTINNVIETCVFVIESFSRNSFVPFTGRYLVLSLVSKDRVPNATSRTGCNFLGVLLGCTEYWALMVSQGNEIHEFFLRKPYFLLRSFIGWRLAKSIGSNNDSPCASSGTSCDWRFPKLASFSAINEWTGFSSNTIDSYQNWWFCHIGNPFVKPSPLIKTLVLLFKP